MPGSDGARATVPELLAPAGSVRKAEVALHYGADAVYAGARGLSMRPDGAALSIPELAETAALAHGMGRRLHVCLNTLLFERDLDHLAAWLDDAAREAPDFAPDACIVADAGVFSFLRRERPAWPLHISTQMGVANSGAAAFWREAGAARIVLARECSLDDVHHMQTRADVPLELFVHGAMCVAYSGRCLLSAWMAGKSGNRGECKHACRWEWTMREAKRDGEIYTGFEADGATMLLGSADLCLLPHLREVIASGAASLKIEGRMKGEAYVGTVVRVYRDALDRYARDPAAWRVDPAWLAELDSVSHRPYSSGFAFGYPTQRPETLQAPNTVDATHDALGLVTAAAEGELVVDVRNPFAVGERLEWIDRAMRGGWLVVDGITGPDGLPRSAAHPATRVHVTFHEDGDEAPGARALLRRRRASCPAPRA